MNYFKLVPAAAEYLIYQDVIKNRYVAITPEEMIKARELRLLHKGTYRDVPDGHFLNVIPVDLDIHKESAGIDKSKIEQIPVNHIEIAAVHLRP